MPYSPPSPVSDAAFGSSWNGVTSIAPSKNAVYDWGLTRSTFTLNVKDPPYNAVGDGFTDDTTAIQSALNDLVSIYGGGTLFFPRGVYRVVGAFDATTNSILRIPSNPYPASLVTIALVGEAPGDWVSYDTNQSNSLSGSIIYSSKAGTGTYPSILAAAAFYDASVGAEPVHNFNYVTVYLRDLTFRATGNGLSAVRMDSAAGICLQDVTVDSGGDPSNPTQPVSGTVGLWMSNSNNFGLNYCNNIYVDGFETGIITGEHFIAPYAVVGICNTAIKFLFGYHPSQANLNLYHCPVYAQFTAAHPVDLVIGIERAQAGHWWSQTSSGHDIVDSTNSASGTVAYTIVEEAIGNIPDAIRVTGCSNVQFTNLYRAASPAINDDFNDNSIDVARWATNFFAEASNGITVTETSQRLQIAMASGATGNSGITSLQTNDFTGKSWQAKVVQVASGSTALDTWLAIGTDDTHNVRWIHENGTLYAQTQNGGGATTVGTLTYSAVTHLWWRIHEYLGTIYWETSTDGLIWTFQFSTSSGLPTLTAAKVAIAAGNNSGAAVTGTSIFDDVTLAAFPDDAHIKTSDFPILSVDSEIPLFSGTSGKSLKRASNTGLLKATSGVLATATAKTDFWDTTDFVASGASHAHGLVPDPGATASNQKFLREDATFVVPLSKTIADYGAFTLPDGGALQQPTVLGLSGTAAATLAGTAAVTLFDPLNNFPMKGQFNPPTFILRGGEYLLQYSRLIFLGNESGTLTEDAAIILTDLAPAGSLTLTGT